MEKTTSQPRAGQARGGKYAQKSAPARKQPAFAKKTKALAHHRRRRKGLGLLWLIPALAVVVVALIAVFMVDQGSSYKLKTSGRQYYAGNQVSLSAGTELKVQEDGSVTLSQTGQGATTNLPIYLDGSRSVVLPKDMIYYEPRTSVTARVLHFSQLECSSVGAVTLLRDGKTLNFGRGFLYDGENFFLFLEPMVVNFNGYEFEVPALSYVEAVFGSHIMIHNYDTADCFMEESQTVVTAQPVGGDYVISLLADSMTMSDGKRKLLISRPDMVDVMK